MSKQSDCILVNLTIKTIPHPNPDRAINLIANLVLKNYLNEIETEKSKAS